MQETLDYKDKFMLTIRLASQYFNIGQKSMRRMAENHIGYLAVYEGNQYLVIRSRMEEFFLNGGTRQEKLLMEEMLKVDRR